MGGGLGSPTEDAYVPEKLPESASALSMVMTDPSWFFQREPGMSTSFKVPKNKIKNKGCR